MPKPISIPTTTTLQPSILPTVAPVQALAVRTSGVALTPLTMQELSGFGAAQKAKSETVTDRIAAMAKTSDMDEVGTMLTSAIQAAKGYDLESLQKSHGITGMFRKLVGKANALAMRFDTVDETVKRLTTQLSQRANHYKQQVKDLEVMKVENRELATSLTPIIAAITERADWMDANVPVVDDNDPFSGQNVNRWKQTIQKARLRASNLERLQLYFQQLDASIDGMAMNAEGLADTLDALRTESVPAMKTAFVQSIINKDQAGGVQLADMVHETTQRALIAAAEQQNRNTVAIATAMTRSNIDLDTFKFAHDQIVDGFAQADRIRQEMMTRLRNEAPQLQQLSHDLSKALATS